MVADVTYVGRMGLHLQRERNINQLQPGTVQANPGVNVNALRPYPGFATIRLSENAGRSIYNGLQVNLERRFRNGLGFGVAYTLLEAARQRAPTSGTSLFNAYDDSGYWAYSDNDRTHLFNVHYLYELPFWRKQDTLLKKLLGGWQVSGVTYFQSGPAAADLALGRHRRRGRHDGPALEPGRRPEDRQPAVLERPRRRSELLVQPGRPSRVRRAGTFGNAGRNPAGCADRRSRAGTSRSSRTSRWAAASGCSSGSRPSTSSTTRSSGTPIRVASTTGGANEHGRRRQRRPEQRRLRARAHQDERAQHPAGGEVQLLAF